MTFNTGYQSDPKGGTSQDGAVFITNIVPQGAGNVGGKVFSSDSNVLVSCVTDTDLLRVEVLAMTGHSHFKPSVFVSGIPVALAADQDKGVWIGTVDIDRQGSETIEATHEDGATHICLVGSDVGPAVQTANFTGTYPTGQSELKAGDTFNLFVQTDSPMTRIVVDNAGACIAQTFDFAAATQQTVLVQIADRGATPTTHGARLRCMNANGSFGAWFDTASQGNTDGVHTLVLNNLYPSVAVSSISYPGGQSALKDNEQATINHSATQFDSIEYQSPNAQLLISSPDTFEASKTVARSTGGYNVSNTNLTIAATRIANGAITVREVVVYIAHDLPNVLALFPATRLRSGGNANTSVQQHTLTVSSDQQLLSVPAIVAPAGTLAGSMIDSGNGQLFSQVLQVSDDDAKGDYTLQLLLATNLAGRTVANFDNDSTYTLGGFVARTIPIPAFATEVALETQVQDTAKLVAIDKDGLPLTYQSDLTDNRNTYTITGPSQQLNPTGNLFRWTDSQGISNNTTGLALVTIEEAV